MAKKKETANEAEVAQAVSAALEPAVSAEHDASASAPMVEGDGAGAAGAVGNEHQGEPAGAAGDADRASMADGAEGPDAETAVEAEEDLAPAPVHESEGVSDDKGELDHASIQTQAEEAGSEDAGAGDADPDGEASGVLGNEGSAAAVVGGVHAGGPADVSSGDPEPDLPNDDSAARNDGPLNDSDGSADGAPLASDPPPLERVALCGAVGAYQEAIIHGVWLEATMRGAEVPDPGMPDAAFDDMAAYVRQIGERATPDVLAQQLVIKKHRASAEISEPERTALAAFSAVLLGLDRYVAGERERIARENSRAEARRPVPIDETNMELVNAPMATWGGRG